MTSRDGSKLETAFPFVVTSSQTGGLRLKLDVGRDTTKERASTKSVSHWSSYELTLARLTKERCGLELKVEVSGQRTIRELQEKQSAVTL